MTPLWKVSRYVSVHPVGTTALGLGPLVASSTTLLSALTICLAFTLTFLLSALTVSGLRGLIPQRFRLVFLLLISSVWVTVVDLIFQACIYDLRMTQGIYVTLLAMNSLILMLLEKDSLALPLTAVAIRTLIIASVPVTICLVTGSLRELLTHGGVLTDVGLLFPDLITGASTAYIALPLFDTVAGAFLITGCILAGINYLCSTSLEGPVRVSANDRS